MAKKIKENCPIDKLILQTYQLGWNDCCNDNKNNEYSFEKKSILRKAYNLGWNDFIIGDDVSSNDLQTDEQILKILKND